VDFFVPSYEEAMLMSGRSTPESIVEFLRRSGAPHVVGVKLGAQGCYLSDGHRAAYVKAQKVRRVVDATGAGDAFVAGFIAGTLKGMDVFESARVANAVAASCVSAVGASTAIRELQNYF
jgi:sugar/nucleoside kinase (ribokinase family)